MQKVTESNKLKFKCLTCGSEYAADGADSLIYNEDSKIYSLTKNGRTIWFYPANQKIEKKCESKKCKSQFVAWEIDKEMNKIYGCACGYSWKEYVQV